MKFVADLVLLAEDLGFTPHGKAEDLAEHRLFQRVGFGKCLVQSRPGIVPFHDADTDVDRGHTALGVAQRGKSLHFFGDRQAAWDGIAVFLEALLEIQKEELTGAGGAKEVLRVAQDRDRGRVSFSSNHACPRRVSE